MATYLSMFVLAALFMVGTIFQGSEAQTTHIVGDSTGWRIPSGGAATYTTWASQQKFAVGDVLVFNFVAGTHDVAEVTKSNYDGCITTSPISSTTTTPANITLSSSGEHYFVCTFPGHCDAGQKLTVTVSDASTATPPTTTATPPPTTTATPPTTTAAPPTITAIPPSTTATPPSTTAMPPSTTVTPPSTTATPPSTTTSTPPSGSTFPSSQSPSGSAMPPPSNSATSLSLATLPVALVSFVLAFLY